MGFLHPEFEDLPLLETLLLADPHHGALGARRRCAAATCFMIAAPSTSRPSAPMLAEVSVGSLKVREYSIFPDKRSRVT
jgi:hypothetical protein